ncbi:MAG: phosphate ABC transporter substrate-binding protein [Verrucomicrobiales bacterium]|nr:phosphate ABC transporter substrate-binding protein [Verrucomicrobiales bacterium]
MRLHGGKVRVACLTLAFGLSGGATPAADPALRINGSTTVNLPVAEAAEILRAERGMRITVDTQGGSAGGISMLADGQIDLGMSSKPVGEDDRKRFPTVHFVETRIGEDAVALIVSRDVWEVGVRSLTREQARGIYEGRLTRWNEVGGADRRIVFFNKEPGRGTWEVFTHWLYGDSRKAPKVRFPEVGANEETRNKVASTRGAVSQLSASWADGKTVFALAIRTEQGDLIHPVPANIATQRYPLSRPLFLLSNGPPSGAAREFVDFLLSPRGQALVRKHGYLSLDQLR